MALHAHLSFITLAVANIAKSTAFYEALGFQKSTHSNNNVTFFQLNGVVLGLYGREALAEDAGVPANTTFRTVVSHNCQSEAEVNELMAHAKTIGAQITTPATKVFWGGYRGYFSDPDGHLWELAFNPYLTMDSNKNAWLDAP